MVMRQFLLTCVDRAANSDHAQMGGFVAGNSQTRVDSVVKASLPCQESTPSTERDKQMRRKCFQNAACKRESTGVIECGLHVCGRTAAAGSEPALPTSAGVG